MLRRWRGDRRVLVTVLMAAALSFFSTRLEGQEGGAEAERDSGQRTWAVDMTSELVAGSERTLNDVTGLAGQILELSPQQRERIEQLALEQEDEKARLLQKLNRIYADKVREVLTDQQRELYDGVLGVLEELSGETAAARKEFLQAIGRDAAGLSAARARFIGVTDPTAFLSLSQERRRGLQRLRDAMHRSLHDALQQRMDREARADLDAWGERRRQFREAQQKARAEFVAQRSALLSPEERQQLEQIEAATETYNRRVREARGAAVVKLLDVLQDAGRQ